MQILRKLAPLLPPFTQTLTAAWSLKAEFLTPPTVFVNNICTFLKLNYFVPKL